MMVFFARRGFVEFLDFGDDFFARAFGRRIGEAFGAVSDGLLDDLGNLFDLVDAHEGVDFGKEFGKFFAETLRQAAGNDQALSAVLGFAEFGGFENGVDTFFLGGVDEGAGVDDDDIGAGGVVGDFDTAFHERAEHDLGIDEVLGAAEGDEAHAHRLFVVFRHRAHKLRDGVKGATMVFEGTETANRRRSGGNLIFRDRFGLVSGKFRFDSGFFRGVPG